ncbi:F-box protein At3g26010-like [Papaver somniferum]|uniref:F-box protein At3g26010-like n=1 Tax=Papaver somniferum TaxID=3469 RepID=UPI000E6F8AEA|nr:F-box protein At3g26010-like [Papaver somniferum]XP_026443565.1 F-box protein At3g26010-like [Papaver somniferum]XP_026443566.1 F-box protein At3g26010-like [Papaver somniferum]XP_026443567.1 F-box protein At3g26010-like [Papaver somniferum]XP_026443568.1 F-box protein At3g26010-like [Papaver somniferum]XP_026443569.1 F-box protein At3g26010-like [Papaver somniferum]XP_026443570.1 F-box protein At3g26010-like [Papaver somniferum]XP_026443571.1 F-box protein At3g26010-like [Papaver somnife
MLTKTPNTNLTDDIWLEIFLLLPLNSIFKLRCVSKVWSSLLSNPNFINKWIQFNSSNESLPWIVFHSYNTVYSKNNFLISYAKSLNSKSISGNEHGFSFRFLNPNPHDQSIYLLDSSNGLVLCTPSYYRPRIYYVCNPLTQKWVSLPPSPTSTTSWVVNGFTCESISSTSCYKVVRIPKFEGSSNKFSIEIFSSDLGEWIIREVTCPASVIWHYSHVRKSIVIVNGVLYWTELGNRILTYSLKNNSETGDRQSRLINFPDMELEDSYGDNSSYCLGQLGFLCYARIMTSQKILSVWVLEDEWHLLHKDIDLSDLVAEMYSKFHVCEFEDPEREDEDFMEVQVLGFSPVDKNVILLSYHIFVWAFNIKTRRHEELSQTSFLGNTHSAYRYQLFNTHSVDRYRVYYPFALKPMPTILPPPSWAGTLANVNVSNLQ